MSGALGCMAIISFGKGPLGPVVVLASKPLRQCEKVPVSALVVKMVGRLKTLPMAACAKILLRNCSGW